MKNILRFFKKITPLLALAVLMMAPNWGWGQTSFTATYTFGSNGDVESFIYNGDPCDGITMGPINKVGVTSSSSSGNFRAKEWETSSSYNVGKYIGFTITSVSGYKFSVNTITFGIGRSSTGTRDTEWRGSADTYLALINNYTTLNSSLTNNSGVLNNPDTDNNWTGNTLTLSSGYADIATSCGFRMYMYSAEGTIGTAGLAGPITITGTFEAIASTPAITLNPQTLSGFTYVEGFGPSTEQSFTVSGSNLTNDISITPPIDYEISTATGGSFASTNPITLARTGETVAETTIYVRLKAGLSVADYNGKEITASSTGADNKTVTCSGSVTAPPDPEPTNHVTLFSATTNSSRQITVTWTDAIGAQLPVAYLVKAAINPVNPTTPANGTPEADGALVKNITLGIQTAVFSGLVASTTYNFAIWPYTNSGATIAYKTDPAAPQVQETTEPISIPDVIITEVYGGGGNSGTTWKNDFIELFNTTSSSINISGWSIQYYSAAGDGTTTNTFVIPEDKSIPANSNFLIEAAAGSSGTEDLPLPDASCDINLAATEGKVILYTTGETQTISTEIASITGNTYFKDYVPYGKAAVPVWKSAMSSNTSNTTSATRKTVEGSYVYTQNIGNDFEVITPTPQNSGAYFRSKAIGNWGDISTWESSSDNNAWIAAVSLPLMKDNVVIDHAVTVAVDGTADCYNLTINGGGSLNIASDASRTGSLIARGVVSGTTSIQRYLTGGWAGWNTGWHQISSPVAAQAISAFETTGVGNSYDFYGWEESTSLWMNYKDVGFEAWNGNSTNFNVSQGYMVSYEAANITQTFTGVLNTASVTKTDLSYNVGTGNGWQLLGNPFASALTWNDSNWALNNVAGGAKIWNEAGKSYSDIAANGIIPSAQGFMVQVSSATNNITIPAASRVHNAAAFYKSGNEQLLLVAAEIEGGSAQESKIIVNPMATEGFDFDYDSRFLAGYAPLFYSVVGDELLSTNSLSELNSDKVIPFGFVKNAATAFTIELKESIPGRVVYLTDVQTGAVTNLSETPEYSFTSDEGDDADRFLLHFGAVGIGEQDQPATLNAYVFDNRLYVNNSLEKAQLAIYDLQGRLVVQQAINEAGLQSLPLDLPAGIYVLQLSNTREAQSVKINVQ